MTPIRSGCKEMDHGESWVNWWLFRGNLTAEQVRDFCEEHDIHRSYSNPGSTFTSRPGVRRSTSYTLITQFGGWDI